MNSKALTEARAALDKFNLKSHQIDLFIQSSTERIKKLSVFFCRNSYYSSAGICMEILGGLENLKKQIDEERHEEWDTLTDIILELESDEEG